MNLCEVCAQQVPPRKRRWLAPRRFCSHACRASVTGYQPMDKHWAWAGGTTIGKKARFYSRPKIKFPSHPRADNHGYVAVHLLVAEKALGKHLPLNAVVHHHTATMLVICENASYHMLLHARQNALRGCGDPAKRRCIYCHRYDDSTNLVAIQRRWYHARCRSERRRRVSAEILERDSR